MTSTSSIRHLTHHPRTDAPVAAALELSRATVVARLMGLDAAWASSSTAKPGWWLEAWARRLAAEQLPPELEAELIGWLAEVQRCLAERDAHLLLTHAGSARPEQGDAWLEPWVRAARALEDTGAALEGRVARVTTGTCEPAAPSSLAQHRAPSGAGRERAGAGSGRGGGVTRLRRR